MIVGVLLGGMVSLMVPASPAATLRDTLVIGTTDKVTKPSPANEYDFWTDRTPRQTGRA